MNKLSNAGGYTLLCIACLTIMVGAILAPGQITISEALGVGDNAILLITLPALGAVIFAPFAGKIIDKYGAYNSLVIGMFLYGLIGASVFFLKGNILVFTNRIALGGLTAIVMASSTVLISQWYFGAARLKMIAKQGMAIELGGVIFLLFGGILTTLHWALPIMLYLFAWLFLVMLFLFVPRKSPTVNPQSNAVNEEHVVTQGLSLKSVYICAVLSMTIFFTAFVLLPHGMSSNDYGEDQIGTLLAFISLVAVITAYFMPKLVHFLGEVRVLSIAFLAYGIAYIFLLQLDLSLLILGAIFMGVGFGCSIPLLNHMTVEGSSINVRGRNLSYFTMAVFSGQFLTSFLESVPADSNRVFQCFIVFCIVIAIGLFIKANRIKSNPVMKNRNGV